MKAYAKPPCFGKYSENDIYCNHEECEYSTECCDSVCNHAQAPLAEAAESELVTIDNKATSSN